MSARAGGGSVVWTVPHGCDWRRVLCEMLAVLLPRVGDAEIPAQEPFSSLGYAYKVTVTSPVQWGVVEMLLRRALQSRKRKCEVSRCFSSAKFVCVRASRNSKVDPHLDIP